VALIQSIFCKFLTQFSILLMTNIQSDWLLDTLRILPLALLILFGLGLPYSALLLPRRDWGHKALLIVLGGVCGSGLLTVWMFILGTLGNLQQQPLMRFDLILIGVLVLMLFGWIGAFYKYRHSASQKTVIMRVPFNVFERGLILAIVLMVLSGWLTTAFWTFSAYDTLWVYGYQGRLYTLVNQIPNTISYYPQYIQLQYAFYQMAFGTINDHVARIVIPFMHIGSILAAYVLGSRLFNQRRVGLYVATIWALYPHLAEWVQMGDLEIPMAFLFTLSSTFFLMAWTESETSLRRQYALISGIVFGVAMWTKPTAGAFIYGVMALVVLEFLRVRSWRAWLPRLEVAVITGIACIPLGAVWYIRNILYGYTPIDLPPPSWLSLARRSGDLLGWFLLALVLWVFLTMWTQTHTLRQRLTILLGVCLIFVGVLPSMPLINSIRSDAPYSYLTGLEIGFILAGGGVLLVFLYREQVFTGVSETTGKVFWALLMAIPYFVTWFYSYSYHARLSFAIVPLLIVPSAVLLVQLAPKFSPMLQRLAGILIVVGACLLAFIPMTSATASGDIAWLWDNRYPDDRSKYLVTNPSMVLLVDSLNGYEQTYGRTPVVIAPGEQQLPFFFPLMTLSNKTTPTQLAELESATHFLYGTQAEWRYADANLPTLQNQIVGALGRTDLMTQAIYHTDATFQYELYELYLETRFDPVPLNNMLQREVRFGDFAILRGDELSTTQIRGNNIYLTYLWEVIATPDADYHVVFDLVDVNTNERIYRWQDPVAVAEHGYYSTLVWQVGESIRDERILSVPNADAGLFTDGGQYWLRVGMIRADDPTETLVPVQDGDTDTDYYQMNLMFSW
jgi:hypothetical protein